MKEPLQIVGIICLLLLQNNTARSQPGFVPLSNDWTIRYEPWMQKVGAAAHTSVKPYLWAEVIREAPRDSIDNSFRRPEEGFYRTLAGRKIFNENLLRVREDDLFLFLDPVFNLSAGKDRESDETIFTNSRGFRAGGTVGKRFSFEASLYENQSAFPYYLDSMVFRTRIVPGQGRVKVDGNQYDYSWASGWIAFELNKHFTFQFGHSKNFIGEGYRSLLLSDNAFNYPHVKIIADLWKFKYQILFNVMQDDDGGDTDDDVPFPKKYSTFHYLDLNIGKHASVGIFEGVIWYADSMGSRGFDINYMNPFVVFRPVEFAVGSPDNVLMGINAKGKLNSNTVVYGQLMLDDFKIDEARNGTGYWSNKVGYQLGFKSFSVFGVRNLYFLAEYNHVRPYTYQHRTTRGNYGHFKQSLAHPVGANFQEFIVRTRYLYRQFELQVQGSYLEVGLDSGGVNFGQNIYRSYNDSRYSDYGNKTGQGELHRVSRLDMTIFYNLNPSTLLSVFTEFSYRSDRSDGKSADDFYWYFGLRTRMFNTYYDY